MLVCRKVDEYGEQSQTEGIPTEAWTRQLNFEVKERIGELFGEVEY